MLRERQKGGKPPSYASVVRIYATIQAPDHHMPWQSRAPANASGSGVVIAPGRVLTGAHVVADATFLQVQKVADPVKYIARVDAVCHDCDLALLSVETASFMGGVRPAAVGGLPGLRDRVTVVGYPIGGEEISITEGVVSRVEVQEYSHSQRDLLAVTVDAAINPGNSGGPAFKNGKVVGIAFQAIEGAENIGELVPSPLIKRFLRATPREKKSALPALSIMGQSLENPWLRKHLGLDDVSGGVLVSQVEYGGSAWGHLEKGDVLLSIGGHAIASNGTVRYRNRYRTRFSAVLTDHNVGDDLTLDVFRRGERLSLRVPLVTAARLVRSSLYDIRPTYFIFGGLVFQPLTCDFLATWDNWEHTAPKELLHAYYSGVRTPERQEVIVLSHILADEVNISYEEFEFDTISSVAGVAPRDMRHFVELVEAATGLVEFKTSSEAVIALDADAAHQATERVLSHYRIPADRSQVLR